MGVTAGAYILTLFAVSSLNRCHHGSHTMLVNVSPNCLADEIRRAGSWVDTGLSSVQSSVVDGVVLQQGLNFWVAAVATNRGLLCGLT